MVSLPIEVDLDLYLLSKVSVDTADPFIEIAKSLSLNAPASFHIP